MDATLPILVFTVIVITPIENEIKSTNCSKYKLRNIEIVLFIEQKKIPLQTISSNLLKIRDDISDSLLTNEENL